MNWVRIILRLAIALVVCWGVSAALLLADVTVKPTVIQKLQILAPTPSRYTKDVSFGASFESLDLDRYIGDFHFGPVGFGPQKVNNLGLMPHSFREELHSAGSATDPVQWLERWHWIYSAGFPLRCWVSHQDQSQSLISWRNGIWITEWELPIPIRPLPLPLAINLAFWCCAIWGAERFVVHLRGWRRERKGVCVKCAYPKPEGAAVCPECGTPIDAV